MQRIQIFAQYLRTKEARRWLWLAVSALLAGLFIAISAEIYEAQHGTMESITIIDHSVLNSILPFRTPRLSSAMIDVTAMGSVTVLTILVVVLSGFLYFIKKGYVALHLIIASIGSGVINQILKAFFERERPEITYRLVDVQGFSYPSGHSMSAAAIYFTLAIIFSSLLRGAGQKTIIAGLFFFIICLIGFSRIYLGVHYFSDVSAGILMGISWASLLASISSIIKHQRPEIAEQAESIK